MRNFLTNIINKKIDNSNVNSEFKKLKRDLEIKKIFDIFSSNINNYQIRFVGGCVRKILKKEKIDDIDLAVDANPHEVKSILKNNKIKFFEIGINHGTITAILNNKKFEITSLRKDIKNYGRHADVEFTKNWHEDASRRDFSINCIYADLDGNLYDPFDGKKDLKKNKIRFIGDPEARIQEDYLRILRYLRFFLDYSDQAHDNSVKKKILKNISGINQISKDRLLDELRKIFKSKNIFKINDDKFIIQILVLVFPELKNISLLTKINDYALDILSSKNFIFWLSILIIDKSDNVNYFLYKYNLSNEDKKRIKFLYKHYNNFEDKNFFLEKNVKKLIYFNEKSFVVDLIDLKICVSKKESIKINKLKDFLINIEKPIFPIKAQNLIEKYNLKEGKDLGDKLKKIEQVWVENNFQISNQEVIKIVNN